MPSADYVIGQPNFTTSNYGVAQNQFSTSLSSMAFDNSGNLWVYDYYRILGFASADLYGNNQPNASWLMFQTSYTAELTSTLSQGYGMQYDMAGFFYQTAIPNEEIVTALPNPYQIDYSFPLYLAFNSENDMWISDTSNYRLVQYKNSDITSNAYPYYCRRVLGQSQFYIQGKSASTQYNLSNATDIAFDKNNNLWCADRSGMVKGFQYPNYSQQVMQNWAIGGSFTTAGGLTQNGMTSPNHAVSFDNFGNMFATDNYYNRILGFSAGSLYGNNEPNAFVVIGQPNFTTGSDVGTTTQSTLNIYNTYTNQLVGKVAFDSNNNMYVADTYNNRIMIFPYGSGFTNGMNASIVLGQTSFTTSTTGSTSSTLNNPAGILIDKAGNLWVLDAGNGRVQKFVPPFTTGMAASISITGFAVSITTFGGMVFDLLGNLLVADCNNNRILGFPPSALNATTTVSSATIVLGQPNFTSVTNGLGIQALFRPTGLAINPATGDLMCVDSGNNRIVGWYYIHKQTQSNALDSKYIFYNE
jgi:streptogramin lyase